MQSDAGRVAQPTVSSPIQAASSKTHDNVAFTKYGLPMQSDRYIELDDFSAPSSPDLNRHRHSAPKKRRRSIYIPNTLWTCSFAITVILETILTVAIERCELTIPKVLKRSSKG
jgi:hypothetical protein